MRFPPRFPALLLALVLTGCAATLSRPATPSGESQPPAPAGEAPPANSGTAGAPQPPKELPARLLAHGDLGFAFVAYDTFGPGRIVLAGPAAGGKSAVLVAEFGNGSLQGVSTVQEPMGAVVDLTHGDLLNNGETQAVVTTEKGLLILMGTSKYFKVEDTDIERVFVGDWENDGKYEGAFLERVDGVRQVTVMRYTPDGQGAKVGSFPAPDFPDRAAVLDGRSGEPTRLMGAAQSEATMQVSFYGLDSAKGLTATARYPVHIDSAQSIASFTADTAGRPTLAVAYRGSRKKPSYIELFNTAGEGMPSRGRITLPDDNSYAVMLGKFTGQAPTEVLAMTNLGEWLLYGLD